VRDEDSPSHAAASGRSRRAGAVASTERVRRLAAAAPGYDTTRAALDRDRRAGGGLLAGALAFRLFAALLPLALLVTIALGYAATVEKAAAGDVADSVGIRRSLLESFAEASTLSTGTRWTVAAFGTFALLWSATSAARAIRAAHALAWDGRVPAFRRELPAGLALVAAVVALTLVWAAVGWSREHLSPALGLLVAVLAVLPFFAIWIVVAWLLPHGRAPRAALVPGALVVAIGMQIVHLGSVLFVAGRVERASATYGSLGAALTILVWLYVVSRVIVASAMLNAALWQRGRPG
jgi:uncharacterized BrkB/YihY/UPF0761 family membrane protein